VSAGKLQDAARSTLPSNSNLHSSFFSEVYGVRGAGIPSILSLLARKTDSAGWL
jgi:hypothetical protein